MEYVIEVSGLGKSYAGRAVLQDVSLSVRRGEIFGLLGANGAGKSTLVECLVGTRQPEQGTSLILGQVVQRKRRQLFQRVGVQFQENGYAEQITVAELCQEMASLYQAPAEWREFLKQFRLGEAGGQMVSQLSGGQRQRLFTVLALLPQPEVVFLDELTARLGYAGSPDGLETAGRFERAGRQHIFDLPLYGGSGAAVRPDRYFAGRAAGFLRHPAGSDCQ